MSEPEFRAVVGLDAGFLQTETSSTHWHVLGVAVLDPTNAPEPFNADVLRRVVASNLHAVEVLRRRVVDGPFGIRQPQWVLGDVDLARHVRAVSLPAGSGLPELAALAGDIGSVPLPRDRPLWEFTVVDGLADGRVAIVAKVHHALVDGVAAIGVLGAVFGLEPTPAPPMPDPLRTAPAEPARRESSSAAARTTADHPAVVARSVTRLARTGWRIVQTVARRESNATLPLTGPRICTSASITASRSAAFASVDIDEVKEIRRAFGVTFNDVAVAITAGVLRDWLLQTDDLPDRPLVAAIPTSVRVGNGALAGNEVSTLFGALPTHLAKPAARVRFVAREMPEAKAFHEELGPRTIGSLATIAPWNLAGKLLRVYSHLHLANRLPPPVNLVLTSVPGPSVPLYCGGSRLECLFPLGPIFDGAALNTTVLSYTDRVCFGFFTCPDVCPPVEYLADAVPRVLDELVDAARAVDLAPST